MILWMEALNGKSPPNLVAICGDMMSAVVKGQDSTCLRLDPPLLFVTKVHGMSCSETRNLRK